MRDTDIPDELIPNALPEDVVQQYTPLVKKMVRRYSGVLQLTCAVGPDDLEQVGSIALLEAQKTYEPTKGGSFVTWASWFIRNAIRKELKFQNGKMKDPVFIRLDEPIDEAGETTRVDELPDPDGVPVDENLITAETRRETVEAVRAAVGRIKSDKQREVIQRVYLDGQDRATAAAEMGMKTTALRSLDQAGRSTLRRDYRLKQYVMTMPFFHVSVGKFNSNWTSAVEMAVIWREEHLKNLQEYNNTLDEMISSLTNVYDRTIMRERYLCKHKPLEIAEGLRLSERDVQQHIQQARHELKDKFPNYRWP